MSAPTPDEINRAMRLDPLHPDAVVHVGPRIWSDGCGNYAYAVQIRNIAYHKKLQTDRRLVVPAGTEQVYYQLTYNNRVAGYIPRLDGSPMHIRSNL